MKCDVPANRVRSSRRLEAESKRNLEVIWLLRRLSPDFKTIADFRRINRAAILVTHQVNITALTGRIPASGEVFLLEIGRDGTISVVDEILIDP